MDIGEPFTSKAGLNSAAKPLSPPFVPLRCRKGRGIHRKGTKGGYVVCQGGTKGFCKRASRVLLASISMAVRRFAKRVSFSTSEFGFKAAASRAHSKSQTARMGRCQPAPSIGPPRIANCIVRNNAVGAVAQTSRFNCASPGRVETPSRFWRHRLDLVHQFLGLPGHVGLSEL